MDEGYCPLGDKANRVETIRICRKNGTSQCLGILYIHGLAAFARECGAGTCRGGKALASSTASACGARPCNTLKEQASAQQRSSRACQQACRGTRRFAVLYQRGRNSASTDGPRRAGPERFHPSDEARYAASYH